MPSETRRPITQKIKDFLTFPLRAITLFEENKWGLTSLKDERYDYAAKEVSGNCLDIGCGRENSFIKKYLKGNGIGIDVFKYEGLGDENIVPNMTKLPFQNETFDSVAFIANLNHAPKGDRDKELSEAYRCLKRGGNIVVTMPCPLAGILVHKVVHYYDEIFGTNNDVDTERGMHKDEDFYLTDSEIIERLKKAKFAEIKKKYFWTQWGLNHMFTAVKR